MAAAKPLRITLCLAAACLLAPPTGQAAAADSSNRRPNILFIFSDDHARQAIGAYGSAINKTPHLDRLAESGMIFRNCFCTNSVCAPSRAVILTGKHSHLNGVIDNRAAFDASQPTFPKILRAAGYQTALVGKWHLVSDPTGFDHWEVLPGQGRYYNPVFIRPAADGTARLTRTGYVTDIITDLAIEWLDRRDKSKPFLLMCQHKAPHRHWEPGPDHLTLYNDAPIPEPPTLFDDYAGRAPVARLQTMTLARHMNEKDLKLVPPAALNEQQLALWKAAYDPKNDAFQKANLTGRDRTRWIYQRYIKDYLRCVASIDDNVGRLLDYLDRTGLADNTIVVYSSDQGFYLGEHGWYDKRWMYEESLAMPLIVRWPGVTPQASRNTDLVQNLDFAETFLDAAGLAPPPDMQGRSLVPLLRGDTPADWRKSVYYHYYEFPGWHDVRRHYGVRTDRYKLIHYYLDEQWELFDLEKDPDELRSVHDDPAYAPVRRDLETELTRLRKHYGADQFQEPPAPPDPKKVPLELVLRFDPARIEDHKVHDASGRNHVASAVNVAVTAAGPRGQAFDFDGQGRIQIQPAPQSLNPTYRPFTVSAFCMPRSPDGVIVAHGEECFGYSLYLQNARLHFNLQAGQNGFLLAAPHTLPLDRWTHVAASVDADARFTLYQDGIPVARLDDGFFVSDEPLDGFSVGADVGSPAGPYSGTLPFNGLIADPRLYWGLPDPQTLIQWSAP